MFWEESRTSYSSAEQALAEANARPISSIKHLEARSRSRNQLAKLRTYNFLMPVGPYQIVSAAWMAAVASAYRHCRLGLFFLNTLSV